MTTHVAEDVDAQAASAEEGAELGWKIFEGSGDISFVVAILLAVYAIFFGGPWQAPLVAAGYWVSVESAMSLYIWYLRRRADQLRDRIAENDAELAARNRQIVAFRAEIQHLELLTKCMELNTAHLRAERERMEADLREALVEQGRREERLRLQAEHAELKANQMELMANQLDIRAEQLAARRTQVRIMEVVRELQEELEERIFEAYEKGFTHGRQRASFAAQSRPHLSIVNPSA